MTRRLVAGLIQIAAVSAIVFSLFSIVPGDFYTPERLNPGLRERTVKDWGTERGLDRSWPSRYIKWVTSCLNGEFGVSLAYGMPVGSILGPRIMKTAAIVFPSWLLGWLLALAMAFWAVRCRDRLLEPAMSVANMVPELITVSLLTWSAVILRAPLGGAWLPSLALVSVVVPLVFLHAVGALASACESYFVRLGASRGITPHRLWGKFILPAASHPLISLIGPSLAAAVGSSLVIEAATGWPGLGSIFLESVLARDYDVVQSIVLLLAILLTFTNLFADLLLYRIDPRIRLKDDRAN